VTTSPAQEQIPDAMVSPVVAMTSSLPSPTTDPDEPEESEPSKGPKGKARKNKGKGTKKTSKKKKAKPWDDEMESADDDSDQNSDDNTLDVETESSDNDGGQNSGDNILKNLLPHIALESKEAFKSWVKKELSQEHKYIHPHPSASVHNALETYSVCIFVFALKPCELIVGKIRHMSLKKPSKCGNINVMSKNWQLIDSDSI
jgi:hypothetical protein